MDRDICARGNFRVFWERPTQFPVGYGSLRVILMMNLGANVMIFVSL
jgi:hypothetical protein